MASIYERSSASFRDFALLVARLGADCEPDYLEQLPLETAEEELGRFKVWLGNLGALHRGGHASLDYRIRESTAMQTNILKLLDQLRENLRQALSVISGDRPPYERMQPDFSSDDESVVSSDEEDIPPTGPRPELRQRLGSIQSIIMDLYKLAFKIRNPSTKARTNKATAYSEHDTETGVELFAQYNAFDRLYVTELVNYMRHPASTHKTEYDYLVARLGDAITARRRQFRYWQRHGSKLAIGHTTHADHESTRQKALGKGAAENPEQALSDALKRHARLGATPSTVSRSILSGTEATTYDKKLDDLLETQSVVSFATTVYDNEGKSVSLPPSPPKAAEGSGFVCPYCNILCPAKHGRGRAWRTHILHDLQPYICTYHDCTGQMYSSRRQWLEHEGSAHRKVWRCFQHQSAIFSSADAYESHLRNAHHDESRQISSIIEVGETFLVDSRDTCPLCCQQLTPGREFQNHLAFHLETIACFALPKDVVGQDDHSQAGSNAPQAWSEESRPSLNTASLASYTSQPEHSSTAQDPATHEPLKQVLIDSDLVSSPSITPHESQVQYSEPEAADSDSDSDDDLFAIKPDRNSNAVQRGFAHAEEERATGSDTLADTERLECLVEGCTARFDRTADFDLHMRQHGAPEYGCQVEKCGKRFYRFAELTEHLFHTHAVDRELVKDTGPDKFRILKSPEWKNERNWPLVPSASDAKIQTPTSNPAFRWMKGQIIGVGGDSDSRTYLGMNVTTGELLAVKEIILDSNGRDPETNKAGIRQAMVHELLEIVETLDHPNIVQYLGNEMSESSCYIFMEYISGGSLGACVRKYGKFESPLVSSIAKQVLSGLAYLHSNGILHRDIRADKILFGLDGTCKITWSFAMERVDSVYLSGTEDSRMGPIFWVAPEIIKQNGKGYTGKADIWAVGCTILELLSGRRPWSREEAVGAIFKLGNLNLAPPIPDDVSATIAVSGLAFLYDCFTIDPAERPTAELLLRSPFCSTDPYYNFLDSNFYTKMRQSLNPDTDLATPDVTADNRNINDNTTNTALVPEETKQPVQPTATQPAKEPPQDKQSNTEQDNLPSSVVTDRLDDI